MSARLTGGYTVLLGGAGVGDGSENTCIRWASSYHRSLRYDTIEEFNMDSKAECGQLNLAHVAIKKEEIKTNKYQCPLSGLASCLSDFCF